MSTFVLIHGGGDGHWHWHLVQEALRARGHDVVAPDLPADDDAATLTDYAAVVVEAVGSRRDLVVVGHSFGGFTSPLVAHRLSADLLILLAGMVPSPGESPGEWWESTGYGDAVEKQAALDGGLTGSDDPYVAFMHDVPRPLAEEAMAKERPHPGRAAVTAPWPLAAWPDVPTRFVICREDRFFPADFFRQLVTERLGIVPDEISGGHCVALSRPEEVADLLAGYASDHAADREIQHADRMTEELRELGELFDSATGVGAGDRVLDIGCGTGESSRAAGRAAATAGSVLGVDISAPVIERARRLTEESGLRNVSFRQADAQTHPFPQERFDVAISRFGAMFFTDRRAAFANVAQALRPRGRVVLMVWQDRNSNEWYKALREGLGAEPMPDGAEARGEDPFSLADPATTTNVLTEAGFTDVDVADVRRTVYYGRDAAAAVEFVVGMRHPRNLLAAMDEEAAERTRRRLQVALSAHDTGSGVHLAARAWIITGRRT